MTLYGFVLGQPGDITVNFTANPRPSNVVWKLDGDSELIVEPFTGRSSDPRVEVSELRNTVRKMSYNMPSFPSCLFKLLHLLGAYVERHLIRGTPADQVGERSGRPSRLPSSRRLQPDERRDRLARVHGARLDQSSTASM